MFNSLVHHTKQVWRLFEFTSVAISASLEDEDEPRKFLQHFLALLSRTSIVDDDYLADYGLLTIPPIRSGRPHRRLMFARWKWAEQTLTSKAKQVLTDRGIDSFQKIMSG